MGVSGQRQALASLCPGERTPGTHWTGGWVGPRAALDSEKLISPLSGIEPPVRSQTLYCLSYPAPIDKDIENYIVPAVL
jgi:hypothetical protein